MDLPRPRWTQKRISKAFLANLPILEEFGSWHPLTRTSLTNYLCEGDVSIHVTDSGMDPVFVDIYTDIIIECRVESFNVPLGMSPRIPILRAMCHWSSAPLV
jgi:hypothetical protein